MTKAEIQTLITEAECLSCYVGGDLATLIKLALLNQISGGGSGGGTNSVQGQSGNYGGGQPTWTPTSAVAVAFDTSTNPATLWWFYALAWH